ncbi:MAG: ComF family protein [Lysobacterales bacterium]
MGEGGRGAAVLLDMLLPPHCALCGLASGSAPICDTCRTGLPRVVEACALCGLPLPPTSGSLCGPCIRNRPPWDDCVSALLYRYPARQLVRRFKFGRDLACGAVLAGELVRAVRRRAGEPPQAIVPVPLHGTRHFTRSFNQAELLAGPLAADLGIPLETRLLRRGRRTRAQSGLDAVARRRNTRGAFCCRPSGRLRGWSGGGRRSNYAHLALVDDVMTTGATLRECARVLHRAGVPRLSVWTAARAESPCI